MPKICQLIVLFAFSIRLLAKADDKEKAVYLGRRVLFEKI